MCDWLSKKQRKDKSFDKTEAKSVCKDFFDVSTFSTLKMNPNSSQIPHSLHSLRQLKDLDNCSSDDKSEWSVNSQRLTSQGIEIGFKHQKSHVSQNLIRYSASNIIIPFQNISTLSIFRQFNFGDFLSSKLLRKMV